MTSDVIRARERLVRIGIIVDSGRRRNGEIVWITKSQALAERAAAAGKGTKK